MILGGIPLERWKRESEAREAERVLDALDQMENPKAKAVEIATEDGVTTKMGIDDYITAKALCGHPAMAGQSMTYRGRRVVSMKLVY